MRTIVSDVHSRCVSWYLMHWTHNTHKAHSLLERRAEVVTVTTDPHLTIITPEPLLSAWRRWRVLNCDGAVIFLTWAVWVCVPARLTTFPEGMAQPIKPAVGHKHNDFTHSLWCIEPLQRNLTWPLEQKTKASSWEWRLSDPTDPWETLRRVFIPMYNCCLGHAENTIHDVFIRYTTGDFTVGATRPIHSLCVA